jgi:hypothetical protein
LVEKSDMREATKLPLLIGVVVLLSGIGIGGWKGISCWADSCDRKEARKFRQYAIDKATREYLCHDVKYLSGKRMESGCHDPTVGLYRLEVCGKIRWYRCEKRPRKRRGKRKPMKCKEVRK